MPFGRALALPGNSTVIVLDGAKGAGGRLATARLGCGVTGGVNADEATPAPPPLRANMGAQQLHLSHAQASAAPIIDLVDRMRKAGVLERAPAPGPMCNLECNECNANSTRGWADPEDGHYYCDMCWRSHDPAARPPAERGKARRRKRVPAASPAPKAPGDGAGDGNSTVGPIYNCPLGSNAVNKFLLAGAAADVRFRSRVATIDHSSDRQRLVVKPFGAPVVEVCCNGS